MKVYRPRFNLFLALIILLTGLCGCATWFKSDKPVATIRVHIEVAPGSVASSANTAETISVLRADPVQVAIDKTPVVTEQDLIAVRMINTPVAPAIEVRFDESGTWTLEEQSASNPGRHFVIYGEWGEKLKDGRWLAAPLITQRITDGVLSFTPDMTQDEAKQFVIGLSNVAKAYQTGSK